MPAKKPQSTDSVAHSQSFEELLEEYAKEDAGAKQNSKLLILGEKIKTGDVKPEEFHFLKSGILHFIDNRLANCGKPLWSALFLLLIQSELISESEEIRLALFDSIKTEVNKALTDRIINTITLLLRSNKTPSATVLQTFFEKTRNEFNSNPSWSLVGILAAAVGRVRGNMYSTSDLVSDIAKLDTGDDQAFNRAVRLRNAIWASLNPPTDSINIITQIRSRQNSSHTLSYPIIASRLDRIMQQAEQNLIYAH